MLPNAELLVPNAELLVPNAELLVPNAELLVPNAELLVPNAEILLPNAELLVPKNIAFGNSIIIFYFRLVMRYKSCGFIKFSFLLDPFLVINFNIVAC